MATSTIYFNRTGTVHLEIGTAINILHYAKVTLSIGNTVIHTSGNLPKGQEYYDWTISDSEKAQIISLLPSNSNTVTGTMKVDMFWVSSGKNDNTSLNDKEHTVSFILEETEDTKPTITITGKNPIPYADYVQSKTQLSCSLDASAKNGATMKSVVVTVGGNSCPLVSESNGSYVFESALLFSNGTNNIVVTATDSRGFKQTVRDSIYVYPYAPPILTPVNTEGGLTCRRWRTDTNEYDDMHGTACRVTVNVYASYVPEVQTGYSMYYRHKKAGTEEWSEEILIGTKTIESTGSTEFDAIISDVQFNTESEHDIEIKVVDAVGGEHTRYEQLLCQETSFNIDRKGQSAAFGKYATKPKTLDSAWDIHSDANIVAEGKVASASVETTKLVLDGVETIVKASELNALSGITGNVQTRLGTISNEVSANIKNLQNNYYNKSAVDSLLNSIKSRLDSLEGYHK